MTTERQRTLDTIKTLIEAKHVTVKPAQYAEWAYPVGSVGTTASCSITIGLSIRDQLVAGHPSDESHRVFETRFRNDSSPTCSLRNNATVPDGGRRTVGLPGCD